MYWRKQENGNCINGICSIVWYWRCMGKLMEVKIKSKINNHVSKFDKVVKIKFNRVGFILETDDTIIRFYYKYCYLMEAVDRP